MAEQTQAEVRADTSDEEAVLDGWLCDDGTMDTVIGFTCPKCGEDHEQRYGTEYASEFRNPDTGELDLEAFLEGMDPDSAWCGCE